MWEMAPDKLVCLVEGCVETLLSSVIQNWLVESCVEFWGFAQSVELGILSSDLLLKHP